MNRVSPRVLIVEDSDMLRASYKAALRLAGYEVLEANSGYAALQRLDGFRPDLMIVDLDLPGIAGDAVLREVSGQALLRDVPVLALAEPSVAADHLHAACVLHKPVQLADLLAAVVRCLRSGRPEI